MIEFKEKYPERAQSQQIIINGDVIGEVWKTEHGFQCQLRFSMLRDAPGVTSMNGTGDTPTTAMIKAALNARLQSRALDAAADLMEKAVEDHHHADF